MAAQTCTVHPNQPALVTCAKCGRPACEYCLAGEDRNDDVCHECEAKVEGPTGIAWENTGLSIFTRFARTTRDVILRPWETFSRLGDGPIPLALAYPAVVYAMGSVITLLILAPCVLLTALGWMTPLEQMPRGALVPMIAAACSGPIVAAAWGVVQALVIGVLFHGVARALGGKGELTTDLRGAAYALGIQICWAPLLPALMLPFIGIVVMALVSLGQIVYGGRVLGVLAREKHGLRGGRAALAAWIIPGSAVMLIAAWFVLGWLLGQEPEAPPPDLYGPAGVETLGY